MNNASQTSFAAELFVAAELTKQGHVVTITFGNEKAIDILVAKGGNPQKMASIDVKGLRNPAPWALGNYKAKKKHPDIYVFCYLNKIDESPQYYIVPKKTVDKILGYAKNGKSAWISFKEVHAYKNSWKSIWGTM